VPGASLEVRPLAGDDRAARAVVRVDAHARRLSPTAGAAQRRSPSQWCPAPGASVGASEAGHISFSGETLEEVKDFTYIALGHLHKFDRARVNAFYAGSLERITWADDAKRKGVVEVDLTADPFDDDSGYVTLHPIENRRFLRLPEIDASHTDNLTGAIVAAAENDGIKRAIVKLPIGNVPVDVFGAIDRRSIAKAFEHCMHLELDPDFIDGTSAGGPHPGAPQELRDFLATRVPHGIEADKFIARAEAYMTKAAEEIGA